MGFNTAVYYKKNRAYAMCVNAESSCGIANHRDRTQRTVHAWDEDSSHAAQCISQCSLDPDGEHRSCKTKAQPHMASP